MHTLMLLTLWTLRRLGILTHVRFYICLGHVFPSLNWSHRDNYSCHIFSPDTIQDYKKSHKSSCFWKIYSKIFWPDKLDKLAPDLYLKWTPVPFKVYHGQYHQKSSTHSLLSLAGKGFGRLPEEKIPAIQRIMMTF